MAAVLDEVQVGSADAAGLDLRQHLPEGGPGIGYVVADDQLGRAAQHRRASAPLGLAVAAGGCALGLRLLHVRRDGVEDRLARRAEQLVPLRHRPVVRRLRRGELPL